MTLQEIYNYFTSRYKLLACRIRNLENGSTPADGNGIYSGNGSVDNGRTVTLLGALNFLGAGVGRQFFVEIGNGVDTLTQVDMEFDSMTVGYVDASDTNTIVFDSTGVTLNGDVFIPGTINGVKKYVALLSQSGTDAPVATVLENTLGGTVVWSYDDVGSYIATLAGVFAANKTWFSANTEYSNNDFSVNCRRDSDNEAFVHVYFPGEDTGTDGWANLSVEIRVYP